MTALFAALVALMTLFGIRWVVAAAIYDQLHTAVRELNVALIMHRAPATAMFSYAALPQMHDLVLDPTLWTSRRALQKYIRPQLVERGFTKTADVLDEL